jgi:hypothetical protein
MTKDEIPGVGKGLRIMIWYLVVRVPSDTPKLGGFVFFLRAHTQKTYAETCADPNWGFLAHV